jgi:hypothetical protein
VSQSAFDYIGAVVAVQKKRLTEATTESLKETGRSALSAEFSLGKILVNMLDLPEVVGEDLVKASSGELTPAEADLYVARSVNVLYNIGATPNKVLAKMIEKKDAFQGLVAYGADEVGDKAVALLEKGIPDLAAKKYAEWKYPRIKALKGTSADFVTMVLQQGTRITAKEDIVKNTVEMKEFLKTLPEFDEALKKAQEKAR